jgi:hypothetical protein
LPVDAQNLYPALSAHPFASASWVLILLECEGERDGAAEGSDDAECACGAGIAVHTTDTTEKALNDRMVNFLGYMLFFRFFDAMFEIL